MSELHLTRTQYLEFEKLILGAYKPVSAFMNIDTLRSVVQEMRLPDGQPFTLPILLSIDHETMQRLRGLPRVTLIYQNTEVGELIPENFFTCDKIEICSTIFGTVDQSHPGVRFFLNSNDWFIGGPVRSLTSLFSESLGPDELTPQQSISLFKSKGWKTIAGFQTRNVPHRAHEYLQRTTLEHVDGLFLQPLVGRKKRGDYTPEAILQGYKTLIKDFYPHNRVVLSLLTTAMRYAGPREAIFHAIIRRNYGCTHFIVGRDHAGVGDFYGKYDAHRLAEKFAGELGITILPLHGPFHCRRCDSIVTEKTCPHHEMDPTSINHISGTDMRAILVEGKTPDPRLMRPEIVAALHGIPIFIEQEDD
ncbi:MAG: sulfate adenylyltransferase [Alphaproteobacteria bacterium]